MEQPRARPCNVAGPQYSGGPGYCQPNVRHLVYRLADRVASVILPPHCVLCGAAGAGPARDLCDGCAADLPWLDAACPRCGQPIDGASEAGVAGCLRCEGRYQPHRHCHAALHYEFPASELVAALLLTNHGLGLLVTGTVVGGMLAVVVFSISVISVPLLMTERVDAVTAIAASLRAVWLNPKAMALWAGLIASFMALGLASLFVGLIVAFPLIGHATWHAYRDLVPREAGGT